MADPLEPPPDEPGFGLEEIGIPGRKYLAESLTNCSDPMKAIEEFQARTRAQQRWRALGRALRNRVPVSDSDDASIRRIGSLSLWEVRESDPDWKLYTCQMAEKELGFLPRVSVKYVVVKCRDQYLKNITGFNNTGNVCVWPSEEALAFYCLRNPDHFAGKSVIELGGGMTCFAGLVVKKFCTPSRIVLSDGNEDSVENLREILVYSGNSEVNAESVTVRWDLVETWSHLEASFDVCLCSDCIFFDEGREQLVNCIFKILKENGSGLIVAPRRGTTLNEFLRVSRKVFKSVDVFEDYDPVISEKISVLRGNSNFNPDLHNPLLIVLRK